MSYNFRHDKICNDVLIFNMYEMCIAISRYLVQNTYKDNFVVDIDVNQMSSSLVIFTVS